MIKLLLDENVSNKIKEGLIEIGYKDTLHINDIGKGIPDEEVFDKAITENRLLITGDDDFKNMKFKYKIGIIWITPKARNNKDVHDKIHWIIGNIDKYNIDINKAFICIRADKFAVEYKNKGGVFGKVKERTIEFNKIQAKNRETSKKI